MLSCVLATPLVYPLIHSFSFYTIVQQIDKPLFSQSSQSSFANPIHLTDLSLDLLLCGSFPWVRHLCFCLLEYLYFSWSNTQNMSSEFWVLWGQGCSLARLAQSSCSVKNLLKSWTNDAFNMESLSEKSKFSLQSFQMKLVFHIVNSLGQPLTIRRRRLCSDKFAVSNIIVPL